MFLLILFFDLCPKVQKNMIGQQNIFQYPLFFT